MKLILFIALASLMGCKSTIKTGELVGFDNTIDSPEGRSWTLISLNGKVISQPADKDKQIGLFFNSKSKTLAGFGGCNRLTGSYSLDDNKLTLSIASTQMFCQDTMETETAFLKEIGSVTGFKMKGNQLILRRGSENVAVFSYRYVEKG